MTKYKNYHLIQTVQILKCFLLIFLQEFYFGTIKSNLKILLSLLVTIPITFIRTDLVVKAL